MLDRDGLTIFAIGLQCVLGMVLFPEFDLVFMAGALTTAVYLYALDHPPYED